MSGAQDRVVVIGAGMGGLAAAIRLANAGLEVTLAEASAHLGGKMRTVDSVAGPVDAGPTVLTLKPVFEDLFAAAGQEMTSHITLAPLPILARHWWPDGASLDLFCDADASADAIRAFAGPSAEAQFRRFSRDAAGLFAAFDAPVMQRPNPDPVGIALALMRSPRLLPWLLPGTTLAGALARRFSDQRLRQLFGRYATYVGGAPARSPAVLALIWEAEARGVWAVRGGMACLAEALGNLARTSGVTVLTGTPAARIEVSGGRVSGVRLADGRRLEAAFVVHAGDPAALTDGLLGPEACVSVPRRSVHPRSHSAWVWSFSARPSGLPLSYHNVLFAADAKREFDEIAKGAMPSDPTLYICAQDRAGQPAGAAERFEIILNGPPTTPGSTLNPEEEDHLCRTRTFQTLARFGLRFDSLPAAPALTGPGAFARMFPGSRGSIYGLSPHGLTAAFRRPGARTALPGLYLAGGGAHPGAGIPMATLSGRHAAEAIRQDRASMFRSAPMGTPGGTSTGSRMTAATPSRSSPSSDRSSRPGIDGRAEKTPKTTSA